MNRYKRFFVALVILLSGLTLVPQVSLLAGQISWQRFAGAYEDDVTVTRARWDDDDNELEVRAISSAGGAPLLLVYNAETNVLIGQLVYEGEDHRGTFVLPQRPHAIRVESSYGGEATVLVTDGSDTPPTVTPSVTTVPPTSTATTEPGPGTPTATATTEPGPGTPSATATTEPGPGTPTATATTEPGPGTPTATAESATPTATATGVPDEYILYLPIVLK